MAELVDFEYDRKSRLHKVTVQDGPDYIDLVNVVRCRDCHFFEAGTDVGSLGKCKLVNGTSYKNPWGYCDNGVDMYEDE